MRDMVLYDQHPLSNFAKVEKVLIDGNSTSIVTRIWNAGRRRRKRRRL